MRQSIAPGRPSMAGPCSTGISNRFSTNPVDYKRYSINLTGTAQRQSMASSRFCVRASSKEVRSEQARELVQFFQDHNALFPFPIKEVREGTARSNFCLWFEFLIKFLNRNYELPGHNSVAINEEVIAVMNCLNYQPPIKNSTMVGLNSPHQWPSILTMLDWLRKLIEINSNESIETGNERQDFTFKYVFDCYKQQQTTGTTDFSSILSALREIVVGNSSYNDLNNDVNQVQDTIVEHGLKIDLENAAIIQVEKEILECKHEIEDLTNAENEMKFSLASTESKITDVENEIKLMDEKLQSLRTENEMLNKQVTNQSMSAHEAQELLQRRNNLRAEFKDKKTRYDKLYAEQASINKELTKLATEKTGAYRSFCSELLQSVRAVGSLDDYHKFEQALFGRSGSADSLRASQLDSTVAEMFRMLMNAIRASIQKRMNELSNEGLDGQLKQLENDNRMQQQQLQQIEQRNEFDLKNRSLKVKETEKYFKQVEHEYEETTKQVEEASRQNDAINSRIDVQLTILKQLESKLANVEIEESDLMNNFADYMAEASTRFESLSTTNSDLVKKKDKLLDLTANIVEQIELMMQNVDAPVLKSKENLVPNLSIFDE